MSFCQCPLFFGFPPTPLSPCHPYLPPSLPSHLPYLSHCVSSLSPESTSVTPLTSQRWWAGAGAWGSGSTPWNLAHPGACPWCLCHFVLIFLIHLPFPPFRPPLPRPPLPGRLQTLNQQPAPRSADRGLSVSEGSWVGSGSLQGLGFGWVEGRWVEIER